MSITLNYPRSISIVLLSFCLVGMSPAHAKTWSEKKLAKMVLSIDRDLNRKRWQKVIDGAQVALPQCIKIHSEREQRCLILLRNINLSYEKTRRFNPNVRQIVNAYELMNEELGKSHFNTVMARDYYYKHLLFTESYEKAIPLAEEMIEVEQANENDPFKILERVNQLYALNGLLQKWPEEESYLLRLLEMTQQLIGEESEDYKIAASALAENYCIQKKYHEYFELVKKVKLEEKCDLDS